MGIYKKSDLSPIGKKPPSQSGSGNSNSNSKQESGADIDWDKVADEVQDMLNKKKEADPRKPTSGKSPSGRQVPIVGTAPDITQKDINHTPAYPWRQIVKLFVGSQTSPETTYARPSPRNATNIEIMRQTGSAALKPGERMVEEGIFKLLIVFDTSGSMSQTVPQALSEVSALLKKFSGSIDPIIGICYFATNSKFFAANIKKNKAWEISSVKDLSKPVPATSQMDLDVLLSSYATGMTNFSDTLASQLLQACASGFNVLMFSDTDMLDTNNWKNFLSLATSPHRKKFFFIADSSYTFNRIIETMGGIKPNNFGHL